MLRGLKQIFGIYKTGYEYWVLTDSIKVPPDYELTEIGQVKWDRKVDYYFRTGKFESPILLDRRFHMIDGYSSVTLARVTGLEKVPVYFVD